MTAGFCHFGRWPAFNNIGVRPAEVRPTARTQILICRGIRPLWAQICYQQTLSPLRERPVVSVQFRNASKSGSGGHQRAARRKDASNLAQVLDLASKKVSVWPGSEGTYVPSWSPDGKYMVAMANPPKRMVVSYRGTKTWRTLKQCRADWGF
jgi:succinylarginine dihydrolase